MVSQPMVWPWVGFFEQVRLADVFVHFDDVQLPVGRSFITRVQVKTPAGLRWMKIPVLADGHPRLIKDTFLEDGKNWRASHRSLLAEALAGTPFVSDALALVDTVYSAPAVSLADVNRLAIEAVADYLDLRPRFILSSAIGSGRSSSEKLIDIVAAVGGQAYITGHGALNYLNHELFEAAGLRVEYMDYKMVPYPQLHGPFTPSVTILDLIANCGRAGREFLCSSSVYWKEFGRP